MLSACPASKHTSLAQADIRTSAFSIQEAVIYTSFSKNHIVTTKEKSEKTNQVSLHWYYRQSILKIVKAKYLSRRMATLCATLCIEDMTRLLLLMHYVSFWFGCQSKWHKDLLFFVLIFYCLFFVLSCYYFSGLYIMQLQEQHETRTMHFCNMNKTSIFFLCLHGKNK